MIHNKTFEAEKVLKQIFKK